MPETRDGSGGSPSPLSVMSFNLRYDCADSPPGHPDHWPDRAPLLAELVSAERPVLLGVQEPLFAQLAVIADALPGHRAVGMGRGGGSRSEHSSVFYDADRLRLTGWDQQWLSDTPYTIGSTSWGNELPRILVRCDFTDTVSGAAFTMVNTHLDHVSEEARRRSAELIADIVATADVPVIVTGDFNCAAGSAAAWRVLTGAGLVDSWLTAQRHDSADLATWHGYRTPEPGGMRIDWVLVSPEVEVRSTTVNTWNSAGRWPSDHCPVQAELVLPG